MAKLALLSVSDKQGLVEFATALVRSHGYTLLSTGGTAAAPTTAGVRLRPGVPPRIGATHPGSIENIDKDAPRGCLSRLHAYTVLEDANESKQNE
jgi:hypothetical protein